MKTQRSWGHALFAGALLLSAVQGCGDDGDDNEKPPTVKPTGGSSNAGGEDNGGGVGNSGTGGTAGTGNANTEGGTGAQGGSPPEVPGGAGGEAGGPPQLDCGELPLQGEDGCFNCPENGNNEQWFNRCVDSTCEPFANTEARLPLLNEDGSLPALPN